MQGTFEQLRDKGVVLNTCLARTTQTSKVVLYLLTRGNKEKVRQKKFPLLQATVTWKPPRNFGYHSVVAYMLKIFTRETLSYVEVVLVIHVYMENLEENTTTGEKKGESQASGSKRLWLFLFCMFFFCGCQKNDDAVSQCHRRCLLDSWPFA